MTFEDPAGNRLEAFHGAEVASEPFQPGRAISGFRTGPLGMGHVVLNVESVDSLLPFYRDTLGFHLSDYTLRPFKAYFFHLNPRHHSFAMVETGKNTIHHLMMELYMLDDVGQAYDLALGEEGRIATTLGRHTNDFMTSFYANTPSGFFVEYGWGGRSIDPANWTPVEMTCGPEPVGARPELAVAGRARAGARPAAARGRGRPARTRASRRGQLHARARHLSLVGRGAQIRLESANDHVRCRDKRRSTSPRSSTTARSDRFRSASSCCAASA